MFTDVTINEPIMKNSDMQIKNITFKITLLQRKIESARILWRCNTPIGYSFSIPRGVSERAAKEAKLI